MTTLQQQTGHYLDLTNLDDLRQQAQADPDKGLRQVALQFEGIFTNMMFKAMRQANAGFEDKESPFSSQSTQFYRQMHDSQMVNELSNQGALGLADLIVEQLGGNSGVSPSINSNAETRVSNVPLRRVDAAQQSAPISSPSLEAEEAHPPMAAAANSLSFDTPEEFVQSLLPHAKEAAKVLGRDPLILIAQSALETGWGQKVLRQGNERSSFNLFNIKSDSTWQGAKTSIQALEFESEIPVMKQSNFRVYNDLKASFDDYVQFVNKPRYQEALAAGDDEGFIRGLHRAGYATDPNYADKVLKLFNGLVEQFNPVGK